MEWILEQILSEAGILATILAVGCYVFWRAWARERSRRYRLEEEFREYLKRQKNVAPRNGGTDV